MRGYFGGTGGGGGLPAGYMDTLTAAGRNMAEGIRGLGAGIARGMDYQAEQKAKDNEAKAGFEAAAPAKGLDGSQESHPMGLSKDQFLALSREERIARWNAFNRERVLRSEMENQAIARELSRAKLGEMQRQQAAERALAEAMRASGRNAPMVSGGELPASRIGQEMEPKFADPTAERLRMAVAAQNPDAVNAPNFNEVMRGLEESNRRRQNVLAFQEDPVSGTRFATYGNVLSPSGVNPNVAGNVIRLKDESGQDYGAAVRSKGGVTPLNTGQVTAKDQYKAKMDRIKTLSSELKAVGKETAAQMQAEIERLKSEAEELVAAGAKTNGTNVTNGTNARKRYVYKDGKLVLKE